MLVRLIFIISIIFIVSACVAKKDTILPTKHERMTLVDAYKRCVANATNSRFDNFTTPDVIVREAMGKCARSKNAMLKEYPRSWQKNLENEVDDELYRREVAWIRETRQKKEK